MSKIKSVLITGGTGFIGKHLLEDLNKSPYHIKLITRNKREILQNQYPNFEVLTADLNNFTSLNEAFQGVDILINTAAEVRNPLKLEQTNIKGTENLIAAISNQKISKVIHLSSVGVTGFQYSNAKVIVDELSECYPKNKYEKTKLVSEELLLTAQQRIGFELDIIRPTNVFGEAHPYNALLSFMSYVKSGKPFIYSKNAQVNYLYVKDLTQLIITLLNENHQKGIINIGQSIELIDFYRQVQSVLQSKNLEIILPPVFIKLMNKLNFGKIETISNQVIYNDAKLLHFYKYTYGEFEGLKRTITYYKQLKLI